MIRTICFLSSVVPRNYQRLRYAVSVFLCFEWISAQFNERVSVCVSMRKGYDVCVYMSLHDSASFVSSHSLDSVDSREGLFLKIFL